MDTGSRLKQGVHLLQIVCKVVFIGLGELGSVSCEEECFACAVREIFQRYKLR